MGQSDDIMIGETVIAIGNPFGFSNTVTTGVVSAVNRSINTKERIYQNFIQTDASINPGNSGGPLLNINGDLIGINTAIYEKAQGIGFAIPINKAQRIISDLIKFGKVVPIWLGVIVQNIDERLRYYLKTPKNKGVLIKEVEEKSPSQKAGIREGDILLSIGKTKIASNQDYQSTVRNYAAGDSVSMNLMRDGRKFTVTLKGSVFPENLAIELAYKLLGIEVINSNTSNYWGSKSSKNNGVKIASMHRQSYLSHIGAQPGDVIRQINEIKIDNVENFYKAIVKYRKRSSIVILLIRKNQGYYITVNL